MWHALRTGGLIVLAAGTMACDASLSFEGGGLSLGLGQRSAEEFRWRGHLAAGRTVEIKGVNGRVDAVAAAGDEIEVSAIRKGRRSNPDEVTIAVVQHEGGVTVCAVYPSDDPDRPNECAPGGGGRMHVRNNDVNVEFTVQLPRSLHFVGRTVNGGVNADSLGGNVEAHTVNGSVRISTSGHAAARTVNGSITAELGRTDWTDRVEFETVNGSITLGLPPDASATIDARTTNGAIESEFDVTTQGTLSRRRLRGAIGGGGRELSLETVNGSIRLRRTS